jgi:hypothetical protein
MRATSKSLFFDVLYNIGEIYSQNDEIFNEILGIQKNSFESGFHLVDFHHFI